MVATQSPVATQGCWSHGRVGVGCDQLRDRENNCPSLMSWQPDIDTDLVAQRGRTSHERHRFIFKWRLHFMRRNVEMMNQLAGRERVWVDFSTDKPLRLGCVVKREQLGQQCSTCSSLPVGCSSGECGRAELMCLFLQGNQIPVCGISLSRSTGVFSACFFVQVLM